MLHDMGQGFPFRPGTIDGTISISAVQWMCNADKSSHEPRRRLKAFFGSLYRCLSRGAKAAFQMYPDSVSQRELILRAAMQAGFAGGVVVDYPHSTKSRKEYLVLTCGPASINTAVPRAKGVDGESCSEDESRDENIQVSISERESEEKAKTGKKGKRKQWILKKKEQMRGKGFEVPIDTRYTGRKRKAQF
ncbi:18S rRNA (guanine-N(7))-methyltransferase RID2 [Linum grandiflorum]